MLDTLRLNQFNRFTSIRLVMGLLAACLLLTSANASAEVWTPLPIPTKGNFEYLVDSVHRIGSHVYLMVRGTVNSPGGLVKYEAPIEFDCSQRALRMAWMDFFPAGAAPQRSYGRSVGHYAPTFFGTTSASADSDVVLQWACGIPMQPERLANIALSGDQKLIQLDTHSIVRSGALVSFWTRYDYPQIEFDPPYDAPYDSKREFVTVNCETNRFRISIGYDFTPEGDVTDNMIARDDAETPIDSTDDYEVAIKKAACASSIDAETYNGIGGEILRTKTPLNGDLDIDKIPVAPDVMAAAQSFRSILPNPAAFKVARIVVTSKYSNLPTRQSMVVIRPIADNVVHISDIYSPELFFDRDMLGLIQLKFKVNLRRSENRTVFVLQSLAVKSENWKEGGEISYSSESIGIPGENKPLVNTLDCHVGSSIDAAILNSQLIGRAIPLDCTKPGESFKYYYLESLGYLFLSHDDAKDSGSGDSTIDSVSIER